MVRRIKYLILGLLIFTACGRGEPTIIATYVYQNESELPVILEEYRQKNVNAIEIKAGKSYSYTSEGGIGRMVLPFKIVDSVFLVFNNESIFKYYKQNRVEFKDIYSLDNYFEGIKNNEYYYIITQDHIELAEPYHPEG